MRPSPARATRPHAAPGRLTAQVALVALFTAIAAMWPQAGRAAPPQVRPKGASETFTPQRPGPRAKPPVVLAEGLHKATRLFRVGSDWLVRTSEGQLWRLVLGGQPTVEAKDLSAEMTLLTVGETFYGTTPKGLWRLDTDGLKPLFAGKSVAGVSVQDAHFYWTDSGANGGSIQRMPIAGGPVEVVATNLGLVDKVLVRKDDILVGMGGGDATRGILRYLPADKSAKYLFHSRMQTEAFVVHAGRTFVHMSQGAGFIKELTADKVLRLVITAGGSRGLTVHNGAFVWCAGSGVYRMPLDTLESEAIALDTNPRDLVVADGKATWIDGWRGQLVELGL